jgi:hypothetical protein
MHEHADLTVRSYIVTLMDIEMRTHQIQVNTACTCDMWGFVSGLDLPITPAFMDIVEVIDAVPDRVPSE